MMSFVKQLDSEGIDTLLDPSWEDVLRAIEELAKEAHGCVTLAPAEPLGPPYGDHHLMIGGDGTRFLVYMTEDNLSFWNVVDQNRRQLKGKVLLTLGGQEGEYDEAQLVGKEQAIRAARRYFTDGERATDVEWTE